MHTGIPPAGRGRLVGLAGVVAGLVFGSAGCGWIAPTAEPAGGPPAARSPVARGTAGSVAELVTAEAGHLPAQVVIASTDLAVGRQRFAFALLDAYGALVQHAEAEVTFFRLEGETATPVKTEPAKFFPSTLEPAGVYVVYVDLDKPGLWGAEITATLAGGQSATPQRVRFSVAQISAAPAVGDLPPPLANRTSAGEADLAGLTSDPHPDPDLYRLTVDEARASGKPTVVVFATPAYCQSKVCGPVIEEVKGLKAEWGDRVNFIHVEVYQSFDPLVYADAMAAWGLATEPWVFVLDREGRVAERLEGSASAAELAPILDRVAGGG